MNFERMGQEELLGALQELKADEAALPCKSDSERLLHDLRVQHIELEMQNHELRNAQSALEESRNRYADLYDFAPVACCTLDERGVILELNLTAATLFDSPREHLIGTPLASLLYVQDTKRFWNHLGTCAARGQPVVTELAIKVRGRQLCVELVSVPVVTMNRRPKTFRTAFTDITARKRAEAEREAAHESEHRLRQSIEAIARAHMEASQALAVPGQLGLREVMVAAARNALNLLNASYARIELVAPAASNRLEGQPVQLGQLRDADHHQVELGVAYGGRTLARLALARAGGVFSPEEQRALQLLCEALGSALEIARLKAIDASETLRLSLLEQVGAELRSAHGRDALETALSKIAKDVLPSFADACFVHLAHNEQLALYCVRHVAEGSELQMLDELSAPENAEPLDRWLQEVAESRNPSLFRSSRRDSTPPGVREHWREILRLCRAHSLIVAPLWARDKLLGTISFARTSDEGYDLRLMTWAQEIAERCASALDAATLVEELREALTFREHLMAMISHDLKSPLNAISLSAMSLAPEEPQKERRSSQRQLQLIQRSAAHMNNMINDLLVSDVLERGSIQLDLRAELASELINEACQLAEPLVAARNIKLARRLEPQALRVMVDRERLLRVFANLIGNAVKFTPPNGQICLSATVAGKMVRFSVSDTGSGVPVEQRPYLFERYWKGKMGGHGLGLGLYIAKSIVEAHGGRIWIADRDGSGATFIFEVQASPSP